MGTSPSLGEGHLDIAGMLGKLDAVHYRGSLKPRSLNDTAMPGCLTVRWNIVSKRLRKEIILGQGEIDYGNQKYY